jgi:5'-nucleotidase
VRILVTNDDGIDSEGLHVLARAMTGYGDVTVVAPDDEYSGASAALGALHLIQPEVHQTQITGVPEAWSVSGPPALCVMFARLGAFGPPFDMVVAGINPGVNVGRSVYHSGTVGAALTARAGGITGVAVSQAVRGFGVEGQGWDEMLRGQIWESAATVGGAVVGALRGEPPDTPVVANVNVPNLAIADLAGWRLTSVGRIPPRVIADASLEPKVGHPGSFRVAMKWGDAVSLPEGTDGGAIERDQVSVTLLGALSDSRASRPDEAIVAAETAIGQALDALLATR